MARSSGGKLKPRRLWAHVECPQFREKLAFGLQRFIYLFNIAEVVLALERDCPSLYTTKNLRLDITIQWRRLEYGNKIVYKLSGRDLWEKMVSAVLDAYISQLDRLIVNKRFHRDTRHGRSALRAARSGFYDPFCVSTRA
jgi:hypothetical protein